MSDNKKLNVNGLTIVWNKILSAIKSIVGDVDVATEGTLKSQINALKNVFSTSANGLVPKSTDTSKYLKGDGTWATPTDTKNTAGSTNSTSKLFLIGATSQAANPQTYSRNTAYVGTDGYLYSNGKKVIGVTEVSGTLSAGATSITLSNSAITTSSKIDPYTSIFGANPISIEVSSGKAVLTFEAQTSNMTVMIRVS